MAKVTLKGAVVHTCGEMPSKAQKAPCLEGVDLDLKERSLGDFKGKKKVICFVPSLDTSVCSASAHHFNEEIKKKKNCALIYVSVDTPFALKRSCMELTGVTPLSLIRSKKPAEDFGVLLVDGPLQGLCARAVIVLDENDRVLYTELVEEITQEPSYTAGLSHV